MVKGKDVATILKFKGTAGAILADVAYEDKEKYKYILPNKIEIFKEASSSTTNLIYTL